MKNSTQSRRNLTVSTVKQAAGEDPGGLLAQGRPPGRRRPPWGWIEPVAPQHGDGELQLLTTLTHSGTAVDITVAELRLEAFLPADQATASILTNLGRARPQRG